MTTPSSTRSTTAINAVARETLHRIASERISPTPETYARIYAQIATTHPDHPKNIGPTATGQTLDGKASATVIARLPTQLDVHHAGITITRKREGLKRALVPRMEPLEALFARLNRLMDSWNGPNADLGENVNQFLGTDILGAGSAEPSRGGSAGHDVATTQRVAGLRGADATVRFRRTGDQASRQPAPAPPRPAANCRSG